MEEWRPVIGYEAWYEVSDVGRVRRVSTGHILKPMRSARGYLLVWLCHQGEQDRWPVHRLVLTTFVRPRIASEQSNHINGIKTDNRLANLEWVTQSENARHALATGLYIQRMPPRKVGEQNGRAKLTEAAVRVIRAGQGQISQYELGRRFGVHARTIGRAQRREAWRD